MNGKRPAGAVRSKHFFLATGGDGGMVRGFDRPAFASSGISWPI
jgi:hypothetical protein